MVALGFVMTLGIPEGIPVGEDVNEAPVVSGCVAVYSVDGSHTAVELSVPVGRMDIG